MWRIPPISRCALFLLLASCSNLPTQDDIEDDLDAQLGSVVGPWHGSIPGEDR